MSKTHEQIEHENKILMEEIDRLRKLRDEKVTSILESSNKSILYLKEMVEEVEKMKKIVDEIPVKDISCEN